MEGKEIQAVTLDTFVEEVGKREGIFLKELGAGRTVLVRTQNSAYQITVLNPEDGKVRVQGDKSFPVPEDCRLSGSTWGGSMLKMKWIGLGMCLEIVRSDGRVVTTSFTTAISLVGPTASDKVH